jgi:anti-sigma regulatory factor (Ser/Thr protein kinase)
MTRRPAARATAARRSVPRRRAAHPSSSTRIRIAADRQSLDRVFDAYERFARAHAVPDDIRRDVYVALEEIVSNVVLHGSRTRTPQVNVTLAIDQGSLRVQIVDDGPPFDPFSAPAPDVNRPLRERPIGGLGILFVTRLTDEHTYSRRANRNWVTLSRRLKSPKTSRRSG